MQRIKSIDAFRGLFILSMIVWHVSLWWTSSLHSWALIFLRLTIYFIAGTGFVFVSGISAVLSIKIRMEKVYFDPNYSNHSLIKEYYYRSSFFFY